MEKMTQSKAIAFVLESYKETLPKEVSEKLVSMKASIDKKSAKASAERKPTKTQVQNEKYQEQILEYLEDGELHTITDIMKSVDFGEELSNQKVSALVRLLTKTEEVIRIEDKRKAYFKKA